MKDIFSHIYSEEVEIIILKDMKIISTSNISYHELYKNNIDNVESYYFNQLKLGKKKFFYSTIDFTINGVTLVPKGGYLMLTDENKLCPLADLTPENIMELAYDHFSPFQISFQILNIDLYLN